MIDREEFDPGQLEFLSVDTFLRFFLVPELSCLAMQTRNGLMRDPEGPTKSRQIRQESRQYGFDVSSLSDTDLVAISNIARHAHQDTTARELRDLADKLERD